MVEIGIIEEWSGFRRIGIEVIIKEKEIIFLGELKKGGEMMM